MSAPAVTVVVPTFNEAGSVRELARRVMEAVGSDVEVLFVDDSTDSTPTEIRALEALGWPVRLLRREIRVGGLSGAVIEGVQNARGDHIVVMDGDLQHPPEIVPALLRNLAVADLVVASRYLAGGDASGLSGGIRQAVSQGSTWLARSVFPRRVGKVTDPMTGFFAFHRNAVEVGNLRPRGFKILLEILASHSLNIAEVPFVFGSRHAGESKASWRVGLNFLGQLLSLRLGRAGKFAAVGVVGTIVNLAIMTLLVHGMAMPYVLAAIIGTEVSIVHNFLVQEHLVFGDLREGARSWGHRLGQNLAFNSAEAAVRLPLLPLMVHFLRLGPIKAQAILLLFSFVVRFVFVSRVVYRPARA